VFKAEELRIITTLPQTPRMMSVAMQKSPRVAELRSPLVAS
jgi:hypothetical protein